MSKKKQSLGELGQAGARALASSPLAGQLSALRLEQARFGAKGLRVLAESPSFTRLKELAVTYDDDIFSAWALQLAHAPFLGRLTSRIVGRSANG
jgi:hypothetical protein